MHICITWPHWVKVPVTHIHCTYIYIYDQNHGHYCACKWPSTQCFTIRHSTDDINLKMINEISKLCTTMVVNVNWPEHDDIIKWKHFLLYRPFVWGIHWSPVNSPHKGQWHGALMFSVITMASDTEFWCFLLSGPEQMVNNQDAGDLRHHRAHYDVTVTKQLVSIEFTSN